MKAAAVPAQAAPPPELTDAQRRIARAVARALVKAALREMNAELAAAAAKELD